MNGTEGQDRKSYADDQDRKSYAVDEALEQDGDQGPEWAERHGVNCYFCGTLFDEREGVPADGMNGGDGGDACPRCAAERGAGDD